MLGDNAAVEKEKAIALEKAQKAEKEKAVAIAKNLLMTALPIDQIITATGLTRSEVEALGHPDAL